eukprot:CAMPEP_0206560736 /NCGR_PEP_ID=MMETSP0325_2-20121206/21189_1 /ASSEMBLY_ACC=CAM_ASM_000347 /TAXON_ID=2866 /ORGANISM="Crypthecodinium cohnii, Strain Seligo" /LENGTH=135 /DNA_ID=CAMNT_0054062529 /DNA_START=158 /DNA_END=565 /DNA_ORIENTATION=-
MTHGRDEMGWRDRKKRQIGMGKVSMGCAASCHLTAEPSGLLHPVEWAAVGQLGFRILHNLLAASGQLFPAGRPWKSRLPDSVVLSLRFRQLPLVHLTSSFEVWSQVVVGPNVRTDNGSGQELPHLLTLMLLRLHL